MLNKKPIFILGFTRGGSNILLNLLRSHPEVCSPRGETQEVFKGKSVESFSVRAQKMWSYLPILIAERRDIFSMQDWSPRRKFPHRTQELIDRIIYADKEKACGPDQNLFKCENEEYTLQEIRNTRTLCKNLNGLIFLSAEFSKMYPDATFIALVRDGYAVCEGHIRRGMAAEKIARNYERGCQKILKDSKDINNYHIIKFEDIIKAPYESFARVCELADLDFSMIKKVRVQHKPVIGKEGEHASVLDGNSKGNADSDPRYRDLYWYDLDSFGSFFRADINENQKKLLSDAARQIIERECRKSLESFGYM